MIVDLTTTSDSDFQRSFVYEDINGIGIDLRLTKMEMMGRVHAEDATVAFDLSTDNGLITRDNYDGQFGNFTITIPISVLSILHAGVYVHSLIRTIPDTGLRQEIWHGSLTHNVGPTRA